MARQWWWVRIFLIATKLSSTELKCYGKVRRVPFKSPNARGIEWSLRALASMRAVRLFLRARAVIKYVLRAASSFKNTDVE